MELSAEQRTAVRWQWWLVGGMIGLVVLIFLAIKLLGLDDGKPFVLSDRPEFYAIVLLIWACIGLTNLMISILSVRFKVTILVGRLKFWEPVSGTSAVIYGWMGIASAVLVLGFGLRFSFEGGSGVLVWVYLGSLFALLIIGGIIYKLSSGLGR